jgi:S-adenosylmethionine:tRNA-ribosyltransferase-isomerase (queuine synthetase)
MHNLIGKLRLYFNVCRKLRVILSLFLQMHQPKARLLVVAAAFSSRTSDLPEGHPLLLFIIIMN